MKEASTYLESPMSKSKWSSVIKSIVREYWSSHIHTMSQMYSSLQFLNSKYIYKGNVHPILKHKYYSALIIDRIPIKLRIVTGTYVLQTKRIKFYRNESDPTCLLCGNAEETIQHFILNCQKLESESERTKILMEISAMWRNIQNCEISFTELDSISQLHILLDSSKYNKVKIDPTNSTRIELLAKRLLFRLHIRRTKLLELDVKRWFQCIYFPYIRYLFPYWITHEMVVGNKVLQLLRELLSNEYSLIQRGRGINSCTTIRTEKYWHLIYYNGMTSTVIATFIY